jgi:hypothetical protein
MRSPPNNALNPAIAAWHAGAALRRLARRWADTKEGVVGGRGEVASLLGQLVADEPGSRAAEAARGRVEHAVMNVLKTQGTRAPVRIEASLRATGLGFRCTKHVGPRWEWVASLPRERALSVSVTAGPAAKAVYVRYRRVEAPGLTAQQREAASLQAQFYEKYMAAGRIAYGSRGRRVLGTHDRLVLVVGELEADLNNGGFGQYLENKSGVVPEAVRALERIGARHTLRLLKQALAEEPHSQRLESLDLKYQEAAEDLPGLTMKWVARRNG